MDPHIFFFFGTPFLLLVTAFFLVKAGKSVRSFWIAWAGLAATMTGDYFLVYRGAPVHSPEYLAGIAGFSVAQLCWIVFLSRHCSFHWRLACTLLASLSFFLIARLLPAVKSMPIVAAITLYTLLSCVSVSLACGRHSLSRAWPIGLCFLLFSDLMLAFGHLLHAPHFAKAVGPTYVLALLCIAWGIARGLPRQKMLGEELLGMRWNSWMVLIGGAVTCILFLLACATYPKGVYSPFTSMLSRLGRTEIDGVNFPLCSYFFMAGMLLCAWLIFRFYPALATFLQGCFPRAALLWFGALNVSGLLIVALVPEDVCNKIHGVGCCMAITGGAVILQILALKRWNPALPFLARCGWLIWGILVSAVFCGFFYCHARGWLPFAPYVPTTQKLLILTFIAFLFFYAFRFLRYPPCSPSHFKDEGAARRDFTVQ